MNRLLLILCASCILCGCRTLITDGAGKPDKQGGYTTKKVCGVTVSTKPMASTEDKMRTGLLWAMAGAFAFAVIGGAMWVLDFLRKIRFQYGDEMAIAGLFVVSSCGVSLLFLAFWKWLVGAAVVVAVSLSIRMYLKYKRGPKNATGSTETGILGRSARSATASTGQNLEP